MFRIVGIRGIRKLGDDEIDDRGEDVLSVSAKRASSFLVSRPRRIPSTVGCEMAREERRCAADLPRSI